VIDRYTKLNRRRIPHLIRTELVAATKTHSFRDLALVVQHTRTDDGKMWSANQKQEYTTTRASAISETSIEIRGVIRTGWCNYLS
jgi:hypothetical protein